ncbi:MAG TPA: pitrilysin family protein [Gemmatimonadaceae bacterium]|jgi:zinc protease|nr:pitrilysin family protein [Gemmatimonadaceae bacterium]
MARLVKLVVFVALAWLVPVVPTLAQTDTGTTAFDVNGVKVILRRNTANDVITANVYLLGGTQQLSPASQGIEVMLLRASERGTKRYPGEKVRQALVKTGCTIGIAPSEDWTVFGTTCIRATFDSTWNVLANRLMEPTLDSSEVELVRERMLTAVREASSAPDPLLTRLADSLQWIGQPYGFDPSGTESSLQSITLPQVRRYQETQMVASRMLVVVVGNVERARVEDLVRRTLGRLPRGSYSWTAPGASRSTGRALLTRAMPLPTNYLLGYYAGPAATNLDYQALRIACAVLSGRFFTEIRSRRNLSYEVDAPFLERAVSSGGVYVTTVDPRATLKLMRSEIDRLQRELLDRDGLERLVQQFITEYFLRNETNGDQATFLARAQIYQGDFRLASHFVDDLRRVQPEDVRRVANSYMHDFRFVYLGKLDALPRDLLAQF